MNKKLLVYVFAVLSIGSLLHGSDLERTTFGLAVYEKHFIKAVGFGDAELVKRMLAYAKTYSSFDINRRFYFSGLGFRWQPSSSCYSGSSFLYEALQPRVPFRDCTGVVKLLLDNNAQADVVDEEGVTPLMLASLYGYSCVARLLLDAAPNTARRFDRHGFTALMYTHDRQHQMIGWSEGELVFDFEGLEQQQEIRRMLLALPLGQKMACHDMAVLTRRGDIESVVLLQQELSAVKNVMNREFFTPQKQEEGKYAVHNNKEIGLKRARKKQKLVHYK